MTATTTTETFAETSANTTIPTLESTKARLKAVLAKNERWAIRAMMAIYANQTNDEQAEDTTNHLNGIGFNGTDAYILSQFAKSYQSYGRLTPKMMAIVHRKMPKYAGQLIKLAGDGVAKALDRLEPSREDGDDMSEYAGDRQVE